jgi:hypothetical protein
MNVKAGQINKNEKFYFEIGGERIYAKARINKTEEENKC